MPARDPTSDVTPAASWAWVSGGHDQVQARHADQHACHQFTQDGGQLQAHEQLGDGARHQEDHHEAAHLDQGFRHFKLVGTELKEKRGIGEHRGQTELRIYRHGDPAVGAAIMGRTDRNLVDPRRPSFWEHCLWSWAGSLPRRPNQLTLMTESDPSSRQSS